MEKDNIIYLGGPEEELLNVEVEKIKKETKHALRDTKFFKGLPIYAKTSAKVASLSGRLSDAMKSKYSKFRGMIEAKLNSFDEEARKMYEDALKNKHLKKEAKKEVIRERAFEQQSIIDNINEDMDALIEDGIFTDAYMANYVLHSHEKLLNKLQKKQDKIDAKQRNIIEKIQLNGKKKIRIPQYDLLVLAKKTKDMLKKFGQVVVGGAKKAGTAVAGAGVVAGTAIASGAKTAGTAIATSVKKGADVTVDGIVAGTTFVAEKSVNALKEIKAKRDAKKLAVLATEANNQQSRQEFVSDIDAHMESFNAFKDAEEFLRNNDASNPDWIENNETYMNFLRGSDYSVSEIALMSKIYDLEQSKIVAPVVTQVETGAKVNPNEYLLRTEDVEFAGKINNSSQQELDDFGVFILREFENKDRRNLYLNNRAELEDLVRDANSYNARKAELNPEKDFRVPEMTKAEFMKNEAEDIFNHIEDEIIYNIVSDKAMINYIKEQSDKIENGSYQIEELAFADAIQKKFGDRGIENREVLKDLNYDSKGTPVIADTKDSSNKKEAPKKLKKDDQNKKVANNLKTIKEKDAGEKTPKKTSAQQKAELEKTKAEIDNAKTVKKAAEKVAKEAVVEIEKKSVEQKGK